MRTSVLPLFLLGLAVVLAQDRKSPDAKPTVVFVCEHGSAKSIIAAAEFERMAKEGNVTPDLWMKNATGAPVGPEALLRATEKALEHTSP